MFLNFCAFVKGCCKKNRRTCLTVNYLSSQISTWCWEKQLQGQDCSLLIAKSVQLSRGQVHAQPASPADWMYSKQLPLGLDSWHDQLRMRGPLIEGVIGRRLSSGVYGSAQCRAGGGLKRKVRSCCCSQVDRLVAKKWSRRISFGWSELGGDKGRDSKRLWSR